MAKNYIDNLSEEARKGMQERAEQGIWPTKTPWLTFPSSFASQLAVCVPAPVTHLPVPEPGACFADPHSPWSLPFAPPTPQRIAPPCSPASQIESPTSRVRGVRHG
jgi:hypothetical protein